HRMKGDPAFDQTFSPPLCVLKYPAKKDETWAGKMKLGEVEMKITFRTGGTEEVEVPAGEFKALVVFAEGAVSGQKELLTFWYAAEVGGVKMVETIAGKTSTQELEKFEAGK